MLNQNSSPLRQLPQFLEPIQESQTVQPYPYKNQPGSQITDIKKFLTEKQQVRQVDSYEFKHQRANQAQAQHIPINNNFTFQAQNSQAAQGLVLNVRVVSKEDIEAPWRKECCYLQNLVEELQKQKKVEILTQVDNSRIDALEAKNAQLQNQLDQARQRIVELEESTMVTEEVTYLNNEVEVWKRKFQEINHNYNDCQEQLVLSQAELEALKKEKSSQRVQTVVTKRSGTIRTSGMQSRVQQQL